MAKILVADDDHSIRKLVVHTLVRQKHEVVEAMDGAEAIESLSKDLDLIILDLKMPNFDGHQVLAEAKKKVPQTEVIMLSAVGKTTDTVKAIKNGAFWYLDKPFDPEEFIALVNQGLRLNTLEEENQALRSHLKSNVGGLEIVGESSAINDIYTKVEKIKDLDESILITGPSGTGKSLLARMIHEKSKRKDAPFVTISCAALPRELLEAEIFGHEKGAFTGADSARAGAIEVANGGTVFLDEIGDLPLDLQPKLLVMLQEKIIKRIGSNKEKKVDIRIIAATHQDLQGMCERRMFREDLFFRLNVFSLQLPGLSDRADDLDLLINSYLKKLAERRRVNSYEISMEATKALKQHNWPGNIRELSNVLERASAFCDKNTIEVKDIDIVNLNKDAKANAIGFDGRTLQELEIEIIQAALTAHEGNKKLAAAQLGVSEKTIYNKLKKQGIEI